MMNDVEKMDRLIAAAGQLGYRVRYEYFGGTGGGICQVGGQKWLFIDLALNTVEQLEVLENALGRDPSFQVESTPGLRKAA